MNKIINISEAFSIAAHCMAFIAAKPERVNGIVISETLGFSRNHTAKVLKILVKHGLLFSERGPRGGFQLNIEPEKVSLLDIYVIIEGNYQEKHLCHHGDEACPFNACIFGNISNKLNAEFKSYLQNNSIKDLIKL